MCQLSLYSQTACQLFYNNKVDKQTGCQLIADASFKEDTPKPIKLFEQYRKNKEVLFTFYVEVTMICLPLFNCFRKYPCVWSVVGYPKSNSFPPCWFQPLFFPLQQTYCNCHFLFLGFSFVLLTLSVPLVNMCSFNALVRTPLI